MKTKLNYIYLLLMLVGLGCAHNIEKQEENFIPPSVKNQPRLIYPREAQENQYTGTAKINITIGKEGTVKNVVVKKSSGYEVLDNSALEYCKSLVFNPAIRNGKPVDSRVEWEIKFNFSENSMEAYNYLREIKYLFLQINYALPSERNSIENKILEKDKTFVQNYKDGLNFNFIIGQVLMQKITNDWENDWDAFPLSFLIFHDFMQRFPDYDSLTVVKDLLINSLKADIQYIINTRTSDNKIQIEKQNILAKIREFIALHYPDINLDELGIETKVNSANIQNTMKKMKASTLN